MANIAKMYTEDGVTYIDVPQSAGKVVIRGGSSLITYFQADANSIGVGGRGLPTYADGTAAVAGGLSTGDFFLTTGATTINIVT